MSMKNEVHSQTLPREVVKIFILGGIKKLFEHKPGQLALGGPAWAGEVDLMTFTSHLSHSVILHLSTPIPCSTARSLFLSQRKKFISQQRPCTLHHYANCKFINTILIGKDANSSATSLLYLSDRSSCLQQIILLWNSVCSATISPSHLVSSPFSWREGPMRQCRAPRWISCGINIFSAKFSTYTYTVFKN